MGIFFTNIFFSEMNITYYTVYFEYILWTKVISGVCESIVECLN